MGIVGKGEGDRAARHHLRLSGVSCSGVHGLKGLSPKIDNIDSRLVRYVWPGGKIRKAWSNLPCSFCTSLSVYVLWCSYLEMVVRYFCCLASVKVTVWLVKSQMNPIKVVESVKGMSFDDSQGIPRKPDM